MAHKDLCDKGYALVLEGDRFFHEKDMDRARLRWLAAAELLLPVIAGAEPQIPRLCYESAAVSQWRLAILAESEENHRSAAGLYQRALEVDEAGLPPSLKTAYFARCAGRNYGTAGDYENSLLFAQRALALRRTLDPGSVDVAVDLNDLGRAHLARGDLDSALRAFKEALKISSAAEPDGDDVAASLNNLGQTYWKLGNPKLGLEYHLRALRIDEARDPNSAETATSLNNVGLMYKMLRDLPNAMKYYERALEIDQRQDPQSLATARDLQNVGKVHAAYAELLAQRGSKATADARELEHRYMERALTIVARRAPDSPLHAQVLTAMGDAVSARGDTKEAEKFYVRARRISAGLGSKLGL